SGVAKATISRLLRGETRSSLHAINKLLAVFDCHLTVRRMPINSIDLDPDTGKRKLPYDDPLEGNPKLDAIRNEKQKTPRP
ncbi:MAG: helix-turn-helix domain-containing protein, partial [bacterium]